MKVYQIILGYIKENLSGINIEIKAVSRGMTNDDKDEIKKHVMKININDGELHPQYYSFFKLMSGRFCVISGHAFEEGYIFHGLVLDDGIWPFYPVQLIGSSVFDIKIEDVINENCELPILESVSEGSIITYEKAAEFIKPRLDHGFGDMVRAVVNYGTAKQPVVIVDAYENLCLWIASIQMAFTVEIAHNISFSICSSATPDDACIVQGTDHNIFDYNMSNGDYVVYDYNNNLITRTGPVFKFMKIVNSGYLLSRATLKSFHDFLYLLSYKDLNDGIDDCYNLFVLCRLNGMNMGGREIQSAFSFATDHVQDDLKEDIFHMIEPSFEKILRLPDVVWCEAAARFLFNSALILRKPVITERAVYLFYNMLDNLLFHRRDCDIGYIYNLYMKTADLNRGKIQAFFKYPLSKDNISYIYANLSKNEKANSQNTDSKAADGAPINSILVLKRAAFCLKVILSCSIELGLLWDHMVRIDNMGILLDLCVNTVIESGRDVEEVFQISTYNEEFMARVAVLLYNRAKMPSVLSVLIQNFVEAMDKKDGSEALDIRKLIFSMECGRLLYDEFEYRLQMEIDKPRFFKGYWEDVFDKIPDYKNKYFSKAVKLYLEKLPYKDIYGESVIILKELAGGSVIIDDDALSLVIKGFEDSLPLSSSDDELKSLILLIKKLKKIRDIITVPNITGMMDLAIYLEEGNAFGSIDEIINEPLDIERLDEKRYVDYLNRCLPMVVKYCSSPEDHKKVIRFFSREDMDSLLYSTYLHAIEDIILRDRQKGSELLLHFCIYYFYYMEPRYKMMGENELIEHIKSILTGIFANSSVAYIKEFDYNMKQEFESRGLSLPVQWKEIRSESMRRGKHMIGERIFSVFRKNNRKG